MWTRWCDMNSTFGGVQQSELDNYTVQEWKDWVTAWGSYVTSGGTRPPNRPPV